jgi:hypothetical protein
LGMLDEPEATTPDAAARAHAGNGRSADVWTYDGTRFTPIAIRTGVADETWTELLSGRIHPGDAVVTSAVLRPR